MSPELIERIRELAKTKNSSQIVRELGIQYSQFRYLQQKYGIRTKCGWARPINEVKAIYEYSNDHGCRAAAEKFGITHLAVKRSRLRYVSHVNKNDKREGEMLKLRGIAIQYARQKGFGGEIPNNFASFVIAKHLAGNASRDMKYLFSDFDRSLHGRKDSPNRKKREGSTGDTESNNKHSPDTDEFEAWNIVPKTTKGLLFQLVFRYGLEQRELAEMLGVSEARISYILKEVRGDIKLVAQT